MLARALVVVLCLTALAGCSRDPEVAKRKLLETGNRYFDNGKFKEASIIYRRAIQKDRRYGEAYYRLGLAGLRQGRIQEAIGALTRATELEPENQDAYAKLADLYLTIYLTNPAKYGAQLAELQRITERAEEHFSGSFDINRIKAYVALSQGDLSAAAELFRQAVSQQPEDRRVGLGLVQTIARAGGTEEALALATERITRDPSFGEMYDVIYLIHLGTRKLDEALATLRSKCESNPTNSVYQLQLARHHLATGNREEMVRVLDGMLANRDKFSNAYLEVGGFYARTRDFDRAYETYRQGAAAVPEQASQLRNRMIETLAAQGRHDEAFKLAEELLRADPENPQALALRGAMRLRSRDRGEVDAAIADFQSVLARMPENPVLRYNLAEGYRAKGDLERAAIEYGEAVKLRPDYVLPRYRLAELHLQQGKYAEAVAAAEQVLALRADDVRANLLRAGAWIRMGERGQARTVLEQMVKSDRPAPDAVFHLAHLNLAERRYAEAEGLFRALAGATPPDQRGLLGLADVYLAQGKHGEATRLLREELGRDPNRSGLRVAYGMVLGKTQQYDAAVEQYNIALENMPENAMARKKLAEALYLSGRAEEAETQFRQAAELTPVDPEPVLYLGIIAERRGALAQAATQYEKVLELAPDQPVALNNLAYILAETTGDLDRALTLIQRARRVAPNDPNIADTMAWIYIKRRLPDSAVTLLNDVIAQDPARVIWRYHLAMAHFERGDTEQAKQHLEIALRHNPTEEEAAKIRELLAKVGS